MISYILYEFLYLIYIDLYILYRYIYTLYTYLHISLYTLCMYVRFHNYVYKPYNLILKNLRKTKHIYYDFIKFFN